MPLWREECLLHPVMTRLNIFLSWFVKTDIILTLKGNQRGVTTAICLKRTSITALPLNNNLAPIHGQKCLHGSCGIQQHTSKGPEGECLPKHQIRDIQTSAPAVDPSVAHDLSPVHLGHGPGAPEKHCLKQSPMEERVFVEDQICNREVPAHRWSKKENCGHNGEDKRNS